MTGLEKIVNQIIAEAEDAARRAHEDAQARAGLHAFCQLGLIDYAPSPLRYTIRPAVKCSLGDSPMLAALRAVAGGA